MTETSTSTAAIALQSITLSGDGGTVLDGVSLDLAPGRSLAVMGSSGCGKSLLLKIMAGLIPPSAGSVSLFGTDLASVSAREERELQLRTGFVFQDAALWQNMSVFGNLSLPVRYHYPQMPDSELRERVGRVAARFELEPYLDTRPAGLSFGIRKLVSFARAIALDPELLFVDEPLGFLDSHAADRVTATLRTLKREGRAIVAATHDAHLTALLADDIAVMSRGAILQHGSVAEVARSTDPRVQSILTDLLSETATYAGDILDLLGPGDSP